MTTARDRNSQTAHSRATRVFKYTYSIMSRSFGTVHYVYGDNAWDEVYARLFERDACRYGYGYSRT